jgi:hypothetical protein
MAKLKFNIFSSVCPIFEVYVAHVAPVDTLGLGSTIRAPRDYPKPQKAAQEVSHKPCPMQNSTGGLLGKASTMAAKEPGQCRSESEGLPGLMERCHGF